MKIYEETISIAPVYIFLEAFFFNNFKKNGIHLKYRKMLRETIHQSIRKVYSLLVKNSQ